MRRITLMGVCLAMLALSAAMAGSASASLPEWGGCEAAPLGHGMYSDSGCTVKAANKKTEGDYEWYTGNSFGWVHNREHGIDHGSPEVYFAIAIGATTLETTGGDQIACSGGLGELSASLAESTKNVHNVLLDFDGCKEVGGAEAECSSPFYLDGVENIDNQAEYDEEAGFRGTLGFLEGKGSEHPTVGLSLTSFNKYVPETKEAEILMTAVCEGPLGTVWIGGNKKSGNAIISAIAPVDTMAKTYTQTFAASKPGVQQWSSFEGKHASVLDEFVLHNWEQSAWSTSFEDELSGTRSIEIKAVK